MMKSTSGGRDAGGLDGATRRDLGHVDRGLTVSGDVAPFDSRASPDPLIGGIHGLLEIEIRDDLFRQVRTRAGNA